MNRHRLDKQSFKMTRRRFLGSAAAGVAATHFLPKSAWGAEVVPAKKDKLNV